MRTYHVAVRRISDHVVIQGRLSVSSKDEILAKASTLMGECQLLAVFDSPER